MPGGMESEGLKEGKWRAERKVKGGRSALKKDVWSGWGIFYPEWTQAGGVCLPRMDARGWGMFTQNGRKEGRERGVQVYVMKEPSFVLYSPSRQSFLPSCLYVSSACSLADYTMSFLPFSLELNYTNAISISLEIRYRSMSLRTKLLKGTLYSDGGSQGKGVLKKAKKDCSVFFSHFIRPRRVDRVNARKGLAGAKVESKLHS
jgi:hypothetical protein